MLTWHAADCHESLYRPARTHGKMLSRRCMSGGLRSWFEAPATHSRRAAMHQVPTWPREAPTLPRRRGPAWRGVPTNPAECESQACCTRGIRPHRDKIFVSLAPSRGDSACTFSREPSTWRARDLDSYTRHMMVSVTICCAPSGSRLTGSGSGPRGSREKVHTDLRSAARAPPDNERCGLQWLCSSFRRATS